MPQNESRKSVLPLKVLASMVISENRAKETDLAFFQDMCTLEHCTEYNGYNTRESREQGVSFAVKTTAVYLPLIDMTPSNPDTIMTAMKNAQVRMEEYGQKFVFTGDLQLYRVAVNILWAFPKQFGNVVLRLGGMHTLMSSVGSVGTLMADSGLADIMEVVFGGMGKMLSGKKFPQNVRALRLVTEEMLRPLFKDRALEKMEDLETTLENIAAASRASKVWINCLVKAVFIMMMFVRAERERDWPLHLKALKCMLPYFFAAGQTNYARYGLYYLRSMEALPSAVLERFMKGEHVMRHIPGIWNGIWSDMFIETTFMRYGHGQSGIIGITLKPDTLKTWALSLHICSHLEEDLYKFTDNEEDQVNQEMHKEEMKGRMAADATDRETIRKKLEVCIDPLDPKQHPEEIVNIVTGNVASATVNVDRALELGKKQMADFESSWPEFFHETLSRTVVTQGISRSHIKVGDTKVFDTDLIYSRVIGLQATSREVDVKKILSHELSPVPTSMFKDSGDCESGNQSPH